MLTTISTWCFDNKGKAIAIWFAGLVAVFAAAGVAGPSFGATSDVPDSDSGDGIEVLSTYFAHLGSGSPSGTIVFEADQGVDDPAVQAAMEELFASVDAGFPDSDGVPQHPGATVVSPYTEQGMGQIAFEGPLAGKVAFAQVNLSADIDDTESNALGKAINANVPQLDGLEVLPGGIRLADVPTPKTELIGVAFAVVVLILAFGSVLAMGLPIAVAVGGVGGGIAAIMVLSNTLDVPDFTVMLGMMIGLGVGIDYALFIVTRFREGLHAGLDPRQATIAAMKSSGRAVIFAGMTVVASMLGLIAVGIGWIAGMGVGVSLTVLATMITSVTLLPALLAVAGDRVEVTRWRGLIAAGFAAVALLGLGIGFNPLALIGALGLVATLLLSVPMSGLRRLVPARQVKPLRRTWAYRWSRAIQRRPVVAVVGSVAVLLTLAAPVLSMELGWTDEGNLPEDTYTHRAYDLMAEGFGPGFNGPLMLTAVADEAADPVAVSQLLDALGDELASTPGVAAVTPPIPNDPASPEAFLLTVIPTTSPQDQATVDLVKALRADVIPSIVGGPEEDLRVHVTGNTATNIDITDYLAQRTPIFFGAVLALSFVLLMVVFRSILVPIKAVIMNVLSIASAYGIVVAVFQWGWAGSVLGIAGGPINPFIPMMLFAIVFGLSMDYEVFMLSRIREEYDRTGDAQTSVADGLAGTARVISAAAAIMVVVFGSFMFEDLREIKLFGLGLALAVLLDATLVRMLLVPATMELLGARNWWFPGWLDRLLPSVAIEGRADDTLPAPELIVVDDEDRVPTTNDSTSSAGAEPRGGVRALTALGPSS